MSSPAPTAAPKDKLTLCMMAATIMQRLVPHDTPVPDVDKLKKTVAYAVTVAEMVYDEVERITGNV